MLEVHLQGFCRLPAGRGVAAMRSNEKSNETRLPRLCDTIGAGRKERRDTADADVWRENDLVRPRPVD